MLGLIMLFWIGTILNAPKWYWVCWCICMSMKVIKFGWDMYEIGNKIGKEDV